MTARPKRISVERFSVKITKELVLQPCEVGLTVNASVKAFTSVSSNSVWSYFGNHEFNKSAPDSEITSRILERITDLVNSNDKHQNLHALDCEMKSKPQKVPPVPNFTTKH